MSDTQTGGAPAPAEPSAATGFLGGLPPGAPTTTSIAPPPAPETKGDGVPTKPEPAQPAPVSEEKLRMAEAIRELRENRVSRQREAEEAKSAREQLEAARAEIEALKRGQAFEDDPVGYVKARKLPPETQALLGQALLYDLAPEKAPPDIRQRLFESRQARKERLDQEAAAAARAEQAKQAELAQLNTYVAGLGAAAKTFESGSHPESEAWFGDDHENYVRSLFATANNMAEAARARGQVADLTPGSVAGVLEQELAARMSRRAERVAGRKSKQEPVQPDSGKQPAGTPMSTQGLGTGAPRPPAQTEAERKARAAEALFGSR